MTGTEENKTNTSYLTEIILTIHNEVQSALDYIDTTAVKEGTALGKSTAILSIQNLRIKVPMKFNLEIDPINNETSPNTTDGNDTVTISEEDLKVSRFYSRIMKEQLGFTIVDEAGRPVSTSSIGVSLEPQINTPPNASNDSNVETKKEAWGEIEITFSPLKRQQ